MQLAMVDPANRDNELVAHTAPECTRLCKREVMRIRRHAAAHKARLPQHEFPVVLIAQANRLTQSTTELLRDRFRGAAAFWLPPACGRATDTARSSATALGGPTGTRPSGVPPGAGPSEAPSGIRASPIVESLARNRSSTIFASAAVSVFLAGRFRYAQAAASSAEFIPAICSIRLSRRLADSCTPRTDLAAEDSGSFPSPGPVRFPAAACPFDWLPGRGSSAAALGRAPRSGASRSSSPAMPTSVKRAYRRA